MTKKGDTYLSLSAALASKIRETIEDAHGSYESISEFVRDAVREKIERLDQLASKNKS